MNDGSSVSYVKTIDGTLPVLLAMMGGIDVETAAMLRDSGVYDNFISIIKQKYERAFGAGPLKEPVGFALPDTAVPKGSASDYKYNGGHIKVQDFDLKFRKAIRPLLEAYEWKNSQGTIEDGDISYFYEHYDIMWDLEQYLVVKTGKPDKHIYQPPTKSTVPTASGRAPISIMSNWKLGVEGRRGWGNDGVARASDGTISIPGGGWTGEMVEPSVPIEGRNYIGIKGKGEFLLEVKNQYDKPFISKPRLKLSPGNVVYVPIPDENRNDKIMTIAITDYTQDVTIEDIFIADSK